MTIIVVVNDDIGLYDPTDSFTADLENDPETGYEPETLEAIFPKPCPNNSWLEFTGVGYLYSSMPLEFFCGSFDSSCLAMAIASIKPTKLIITVWTINMNTRSGLISNSLKEKFGRPCGIIPTIGPW